MLLINWRKKKEAITMTSLNCGTISLGIEKR